MFPVRVLYIDNEIVKERYIRQVEPEDKIVIFENNTERTITGSELEQDGYVLYFDENGEILRLNMDRVLLTERL